MFTKVHHSTLGYIDEDKSFMSKVNGEPSLGDKNR